MDSSKKVIISSDSSATCQTSARMHSGKTVAGCASGDRNRWVWGFTPQAEIWNGRLAMLGFSSVLLTQYLSRQGIINFYDLLHTTAAVVSTMP
jgi:Chlorophyll A-B binding protein